MGAGTGAISTWDERRCWIAVFDILGFKARIETDQPLHRSILISQINDLVESLKGQPPGETTFSYLIFSDTFVILAQDLLPSSYAWFLHVCKTLIERSIYVELPLRGAISAGVLLVSMDPPILLGSAFVEAYEYCEDQNWLGLVLTPSATISIRQADLEPLHHDFVHDAEMPLRAKSAENVLAYRFQNGSASFKSPLFPHLEQMKHFAKRAEDKEKYERTINFISRHYRFKTPGRQGVS